MGVLSKLLQSPMARPVVADLTRQPLRIPQRTLMSSSTGSLSSASTSLIGKPRRAWELISGTASVSKRLLHRSTASASSASSETAIQLAWQKQALPVALVAATAYLLYDNRRLRRRAADESQLERVALLQQQLLQQQVAPSALVVSEQEREWETPPHQSDAVKEVEESVGVDSVEGQVDPTEGEVKMAPGEPEPDQILQDSGE